MSTQEIVSALKASMPGTDWKAGPMPTEYHLKGNHIRIQREQVAVLLRHGVYIESIVIKRTGADAKIILEITGG